VTRLTPSHRVRHPPAVLPSCNARRRGNVGFDSPTLAWIALSTLVAFIVRGLSGFGSALIGIGSLHHVFTDLYGLAWAASAGLLADLGWKLIAAAVPFALLGLLIGHRLYVTLDEARLRRVIWALLAVLGTAGTAGAVMRIVG
jgi:hypothetical protein